MSVKKELRILILEDLAADVILINSELRRGGIPFHMKRVETREEFQQEITHDPPDLILSDHGLPSFDGFSAMSIAHARCPDTPFIFVTGSMGEELAIDSLRSGATDYVLKSRLAKLVPAIQRALHLAEEQTKRKQAEKELRESEERFRLLVSGVKDYAIFMLDPEGRISSWNTGAEWIQGYRASEIIGQHFNCFDLPENREQGKSDHDLKTAAGQGRFEEEGQRVRKGGSIFSAHVVITPLRDEFGQLRGFTHITRDVTDRQKSGESLRKSEERYRRLVELCPDAFFLLGEERIVFANAAAQKLLGAERSEQLLGRALADFVQAGGREVFVQRLHQLAASDTAEPWEKTGPPISAGQPGVPAALFTEETFIRLDENRITVEVAAARMPFKDEPAVQLIVHDITEQKRAAAALYESESHKSAILATSLDAIVSIDQQGLVHEWNVAAERLFGYARAEAMGRRLDNLIVPAALQERYLPRLTDYLMTGAGSLIGRPIELVARRAGGEQFPIELAITQVHSSAPPIFTVFMRDITDRKRAEEALRRSEARKAAVVETALDAIISIDHEEKIIEWNPAAEKIFGYSRELALGRTMADLILPSAELEKYHQHWPRNAGPNRGRAAGQRIEMTAKRANGAEFPIEFAMMRISGEEPPTFTAYIRDITEQKHAVEELRQSEERLRLLVEDAKDYAIYMLDPNGRVISWNLGAERIEGYRSQEILGRTSARFYTAEDVERGKPEQTLAVAKAEGRFQEERWGVRKDGSRYWANIVVTALRNEKGKLYGFSKIAHDMSKYKEAEDETRRLNAELERRVKERTAELQRTYDEMESFSYSISHDLRTPLIQISGFAEILLKELGSQLTGKNLAHLKTIVEATHRLGKMIDDLLAFAHTSRAEMHKMQVDLGEIIRKVQRDLQNEQQNRQITWTIRKLPEVAGDPILVRQVIFNLVVNALKYTRSRAEARIEIGAQPAEQEVIIFIRDNGVGFDVKYADKLFGVFQRLHSAAEFEGNGIGLANVRRIIQRHGGRTWAEGAVDEGATFYFSLPKENTGGAS